MGLTLLQDERALMVRSNFPWLGSNRLQGRTRLWCLEIHAISECDYVQMFASKVLRCLPMTGWSFLTNHAWAMLFIAAHPDARLRDIAAVLSVTERTAYAVVADLAAAGYLVKERVGRRSRYHIQEHLPLPDSKDLGWGDLRSREWTVGELLDLLLGTKRPTVP